MGLKIPELDNKTFAQLVEEARLLIPRYAKQWTDHNLHDPGITFIDLFAWLAEMQIYQLNRVSESHYKKFLEIVGIESAGAKPAVTTVTFENVPNRIFLKAGTRLETKPGGKPVIFETTRDIHLTPIKLKSVISKNNNSPGEIDHTAINETGAAYYAPFGKKARPGAELWLGFDQPPGEHDIHIEIVLYEAGLPPVSPGNCPVYPSAHLAWEYLDKGNWKPLPIKTDTTLELNKTGAIIFTGPPAMDKKGDFYWIRCRLEKGKYEIIPLIHRIQLNTVSAAGVETIKKENLGEGSGTPHQAVTLKNGRYIPGSLEVEVQGDDYQWEKWEKEEDFDASAPGDRHYIIEPGTGEIRFGNGLNGRIPQQRHRIRATYKIIPAAREKIPRGQTFRVTDHETIPPGKNREEIPAAQDAETMEQAAARARKDLRTPHRAVTSADYEQLALRTPGLRVVRAKALVKSDNGSFPREVTVVVVPYTRKDTDNPGPGPGFLRTVCNYLDKSRLITTGLKVIAPGYVEIFVKCDIHIKPQNSPTAVETRVKKALTDFLDPAAGGPGKKGWPFGRPVFPSEIYQVIDKVEGVDYAADVVITAEGALNKGGGKIEIGPEALVYPGNIELKII